MTVRINRAFFIFTSGFVAGSFITILCTQIILEKGPGNSYCEKRNNCTTVLYLDKSALAPVNEKPDKHDLRFAGNKSSDLVEESNKSPQQLDNNISNYENIYSQSHACSLFGRRPIPSAVTIWKEHLSKVVPSSRHPNEEENKYVMYDFTVQLLNYMSPNRLHKSVKTLPFEYWENVGDILDIVKKRWDWIDGGRSPVHPEPRKVNIMVFGGSVTLGVLCSTNPLSHPNFMSRFECSWSYRLQRFLTAMTGRDLFDIKSVTIGGTNTATATEIWEYASIQENTTFPDIIINAYSTNDMHIITAQKAEKHNTTLEEEVFQMNELFIRTVLSTSSAVTTNGTYCTTKPPLLLYFDDYIGNEQREIRKTLSFSKAINTLSAYYGFGFISYADAVRDLVLTNTNENWFSPSDWPKRQIHPGMGMHISSAWIFAFNFLTIATMYCEIQTARDKRDENSYSSALHLLYNSTEEIKDRPLPKPSALPPKLDQNLTLDNVTKIWQKAGKLNSIATELETLSTCDINEVLLMPTKCLFAWVGKLLDVNDIMTQLSNAVVERYDWTVWTGHGKVGYVAAQPNARFAMKFTDISRPAKTVNFMAMKSYGDDWKGSMIHVKVFVIPKGSKGVKREAASMNITGYHDKETSEIFVHKMKLSTEAEIGDRLLIDVKLIGGKTFKITGMAICNH